MLLLNFMGLKVDKVVEDNEEMREEDEEKGIKIT